MFGYVLPCKLELKIKDYEKYKAYYCGLCKTIKGEYGNIPRLSLNYDMTFLSILLDSLSIKETIYEKGFCIVHPLKKKIWIKENSSLEYASFCNIVLSLYKLKDNSEDDKSLKDYLFSKLLLLYIKIDDKIYIKEYVEKSLFSLYDIESNPSIVNIDEICNPFSDLTAFILSTYINYINIPSSERVKDNLYNLGYNLGKWIYLIDAYDDLEKDIKKNSFNPLIRAFKKESIKEKVEYMLICCASSCLEYLDKLPLTKNEDLLQNILELGLIEKMNEVFKRRDNYEKSL